jgi:ketosteroid isomerase-like protein
MTASSDLESMARDLFDALDRKEFDRMVGMSTDDVQGVDEISRGWLRGRAAMDGYLKSLGEQVSNVRSTLSDINTLEIGEAGIVTFVLDQEYDMGGQHVSIHAPTSLVGRRVDGAWRLALLHSVPLAEES